MSSLYKDNQPTLKRDIEALDLTLQKSDDETTDKGHGRIETRRIWCSDALNHDVNFPNVAQVFCIEREVMHLKRRKNDIGACIRNNESVKGKGVSAENTLTEPETLAY